MFVTHINDSLTKKACTVGRITPNLEAKLVNPKTNKIVPWGS